MFLSTLLDMELVQALNPLYAFPIVAVILCAFIVYAFGFKSPVQPPSFDGIEEKKSSKKRKTKEVSKSKAIQNGKMNGSTTNKVSISSVKKKDIEKSANEKPVIEKSSAEKKATKKAKPSNEKKVVHEKKKESFSQDDTGEDGWVQLVSKKGRKSRKKEEVGTTESPKMTKPMKSSRVEKPDENTPSEEILVHSDVSEKPIPEKKLAMKNTEDVEAKNLENLKEKVIIIEAEPVVNDDSEKIPLKDITMKNEMMNEETSSKSKKKKKKAPEVVKADNDIIVAPKPPAVQVTSEAVIITQNAPTDAPVITETPEIIAGNLEENQPKEMKSSNVVLDELAGMKSSNVVFHELAAENQPKEMKSSNVVFDELAGLYPQEKEQRKKKKVRRDH